MKVRYYGHFGESGYSRAAIDMCMALIRAGATVEIRPFMKVGEVAIKIAGMPREVAASLRTDAELTEPDAVIVHDLPVDAPKRDVGMDSDSVDKPRVCYTTWEATTCPFDIVERLRTNFNAVWVPSTVTRSALLLNQADEQFATSAVERSPCWAPVDVVPHSFDPDDRRQSETPPRGMPFRFYYVGAWNRRKNPPGLVRAWAQAFTRADDVELVLQITGASPHSIATAVAATGLTPNDMAPIRFQTGYLHDEELAKLHRESDCFVTASCGEAWNLPCFDAMLARRHVISTAGLGSGDFLAGTSWTAIPAHTAPASVDVSVQLEGNRVNAQRTGAQGLSSRDTWLEPNMTRLVGSLRDVAQRRTRDLSVFYDPIERFGYEAVGKLALKKLEEIANRYDPRREERRRPRERARGLPA